jgi:putative transposase
VTVNQAFRYEPVPNVRQRVLLARSAGTARQRLPGAGRPGPHARELPWNAEKPQRSWVNGALKCCGQGALRDRDRACANFWRRRRAKRGRRVGFPNLRRKPGRRDSFRLTGSIQVQPRAVTLPRSGCVRTKETTARFPGRILSATVSREAERGCASLAVEVEGDDPQPVDGPVVGVDLGLAAFAALSDGRKVEAPKPLAKALHRLGHGQRLHSRKRRGSRNRRKSALSLARLPRRIGRPRTDFLHKLTTKPEKTKAVSVVAELSVQGLLQSRHLARTTGGAGWGGFRRMLEYETERHGSRLAAAPRFYPSTKTCSACGHVQGEIPLDERVVRCGACGEERDRERNAARNLAAVAGGCLETQNLWAGEGSGQDSALVKAAPGKQETSRRNLAAPVAGNKRR